MVFTTLHRMNGDKEVSCSARVYIWPGELWRQDTDLHFNMIFEHVSKIILP